MEKILEHRPVHCPEMETNLIFPFTKLSENISDNDYVEIYRIITEHTKKTDAIIVTHGTDTITYTLAAISLLCRECPVPIIFTGALYPFDHPLADGEKNFWEAISFAHDCIQNERNGTYLVFNTNNTTRVFWGPFSTEYSYFEKSFKSIDNNYFAIKKHGKFITNLTNSINPEISSLTIKHTRFAKNVAILKIYPNFNPSILNYYQGLGCKIIILQLFHSGTASTKEFRTKNNSLPHVISALKDKMLIFGLGISNHGATAYRSSMYLINSGLQPLKKMSLEMAYMKAKFFLANLKFDNIKIQMNKPYCKEICND